MKELKGSISVTELYLPYSQLLLKNIVANLQMVKKQDASLYHMTGDAHYVVMALPGNKTILTIHDCVFLEDNKGLKRKILKYFFLEWPVRHVRYITTISQKSKLEILKYTGCSENKITVIHNPVSASIYYEVKHFNVSQPTILFLGTKDNKNLQRSIQAIEGLACHLVIIGNLSEPITQLLNKCRISYESKAGISEADLALRYALSDIILFPSTYEGFGLPVIEGNKAGRVVVTSNIEPMTEVAGNAAHLVDPYSIQSIKDGIVKVIQDEGYRNQLINNGFKNIERFEPAFIAAQYEALYRTIVQNDRKG